MEICNLENTSIEEIHSAFLSAFSNYEVEINMPFEKLVKTINAKDYYPPMSVGCFDKRKLVGFILIGKRIEKGKSEIYDIATGVISGYQKKGIGSRLLEYLLAQLKIKDITCFRLEVLENNQSAISLYRKYYFKSLRYLKCFELKNELIKKIDSSLTLSKSIKNIDKIDEENYLSFKPTWQNALKTYAHSAADYSVLSYSIGKALIGYGVIHKKDGGVLQLGLLPEYRNQGIESILLYELSRRTDSSNIRFINIEEKSHLDIFLTAKGFNNFINQYEMIYDNSLI